MCRTSSSMAVIIAIALCGARTLVAQATPPVEFDVASIKRNTSGSASGGIRNLPDGTVMMTNQPIRSMILSASPVPAREVVGYPEWVDTERYDMTAKPPAGATREQQRQMWQQLFKDRMKLVAHVEERERNTFALVLDRSDGRLGPQLKPSSLDCSPRPAGSPAPPPPQVPPSAADAGSRCGMSMSATSIVSGGIDMDRLVPSLGGLAGGLVNNRTGLQGNYALTLTFTRERPAGAPADGAAPDDAPGFFTALREQLGLRLQPEKTMVPVFVIDRIERPSEN